MNEYCHKLQNDVIGYFVFIQLQQQIFLVFWSDFYSRCNLVKKLVGGRTILGHLIVDENHVASTNKQYVECLF